MTEPPFANRVADMLKLVVASFKSLNTTGSINKLLFAGKKRMAGRADFSTDLFQGGTGLECVAAQTLYSYLGIHWVNTFFHIFLLKQYWLRVST